jgi:CheY-like chemotaxis protein
MPPHAKISSTQDLPLQPETILIVDDDGDIREALSELLRAEGYEAALASDGREALQLLSRAETCPAAILLDLMMPVMDGWEFLARKESDPRLSSIPVIVISACGRRARSGASLHLEKPFDAEMLVSSVHRCISSR